MAMNESPTNAPAPDDLTEQVASLRCQVNLLLLALIIVSGTLATYLLYQSHAIGRDLAVLEPQAQAVVQNYDRNIPAIQKFVQDLTAYGQQHPDFQLILKKYGILPPPPAANAAPAK